MIDQVGGRLDHPTGATRGAESASLAGEGDQVFVAASVALNAQEAVLEEVAFQVVVELPPDECGQRTAFGFESGEKLRVVSLDDSVEWRLFWAVALVDIAVGAAGLRQFSWPVLAWFHEAARDRTACLRTYAMVCWRLGEPFGVGDLRGLVMHGYAL